MSAKLLERVLVDPITHSALALTPGGAVTRGGETYPVVRGVPVLLRANSEETHFVLGASLRAAHQMDPSDPYCLSSIGVSQHERDLMKRSLAKGADGRSVIRFLLPATNGMGFAYGNDEILPIPTFPRAGSGLLLDLGCGWGRWSIAAARRGYEVVGIDPSLGSLLAGQDLLAVEGLPIAFVCGDARCLPFADNSFDAVFSYSVLQHFSRENVAHTLREVGRVLRPGGFSLIQMARRLGLRSLYHLARRAAGSMKPHSFEVRYWRSRDLRELFGAIIGPTDIGIDCFFGLGLQAANAAQMKPLARWASRGSEALKRLDAHVPIFVNIADSVWCLSHKPQQTHETRLDETPLTMDRANLR